MSDEESKELNPDGGAAGGAEDAATAKNDHFGIEKIRQFFSEKLHLITTNDEPEESNRTVLDTVDINGVIKLWKAKGFKKIVTMVGAGVSTSAGVPDFRTPKTGLYDNLAKYNLPYPEAIFDLDYFHSNPKPFFQLAKELYPGTFKPTKSHYFIKLLHDKGLLVRHYTQNIDTLDRLVGLPEDKIVEAHGTFYTNHCVTCRKEFSMEWMKEKIFSAADDEVPSCDECDQTVKPDIVFFGENLPERFYQMPNQDFKECDLLIIMGTSLTVHPFAGLVDYANDDCVRLLINRDKVGSSMGFFRSLVFGEGLCFDLPGNRRDVCWQGDCDEGSQYLADQLGFGDELRDLVEKEHARIDAEKEKEKQNKTELKVQEKEPEQVPKSKSDDNSEKEDDKN